MRLSTFPRTGILCAVLLGSSACEQSLPEGASSQVIDTPTIIERSYEARIGTAFDTPDSPPITGVVATEIELPAEGGDSIWGALGVTAETNVWAGISGSGSKGGQLLSLKAVDNVARSRGSVADQRIPDQSPEANQTQSKIHSRIREADDGFVYFTSMDETNESWRDKQLPQYGGRLWRLKPGQKAWEQVMTTPEALIALETTGRYVYALGYWGHVLYQFDTSSGRTERLQIGSDCGHVSRNFLVDLREHVYVPKVVSKPGSTECRAEDMTVSLVEVSPTMQVVAAHALPDYLGISAAHQSQGITAYAYRQDESIIFSTMNGDLYHLIAHGRQPALILPLGNMLPGTKSKVTNLVSLDGKSLLGAAVMLRGKQEKGLHWLVHDTSTTDTRTIPINLPADLQPFKAVLLYGSGIRDGQGHVYVGGRIQHQSGRIRPLLLRLSFVR
ncbi:hypothetical protein N9241_02145 [bacterium]|nr:hypothetical protein [bacterium]